MKNPLNRSSAPIIIRFFDICFKQGVIDARVFDDDASAKEFLDSHKESWDFGVLGLDDFDGWQEWRFVLYRWGRQHHMTKFSENYIYRIAKKNYLWYFLPFCMRFYLMGIEEWLKYPNPSGIELFKKESKVHWMPIQPSLRKMTTNDFISYMQEFVYDFRRSPLSKGEDRIMVASAFDAFQQAIHDLTRGFKTGRKIKIEDDE